MSSKIALKYGICLTSSVMYATSYNGKFFKKKKTAEAKLKTAKENV